MKAAAYHVEGQQTISVSHENLNDSTRVRAAYVNVTYVTDEPQNLLRMLHEAAYLTYRGSCQPSGASATKSWVICRHGRDVVRTTGASSKSASVTVQ